MTAVAESIDIGATISMVPLASIQESCTNPRKHFGEAELSELTESVRAEGLLVPLLLRPHPKMNGAGGYELVDGARRFRAAAAAGLTTVPAMVRPLSDAAALEIQVITNLQRVDVPPIEEAEGYAALLQLPGYTVERLASKVGKSVTYVGQRVKLLDLVAPVRERLRKGELPLKHAVLIGRLAADDQEKALEGAFTWEGLARPFERFAEHLKWQFHKKLKQAPFDRADAALLPAAGSCAACPKRTGAASLFPDLDGKDDECLDSTCFEAKLAAHVEGAITGAKAAGKELVQLSSRWSDKRPAPGKPVPGGQWQAASKGDKDAVRGIHVNGQEIGRLQYVKLKLAKEAKPMAAHTAAARDASAAAEQQRHRDDNAREEVAMERTIERVRTAILGKVTAPLPAAFLVEVIVGGVMQLTHDEKKALGALIAFPKLEGSLWGKGLVKVRKRLAALDEATVGRAAMLVVLCEEACWDADAGAGSPLGGLAAAYDVSVKQVRQEVVAELKVEAVAKAAKAKTEAAAAEARRPVKKAARAVAVAAAKKCAKCGCTEDRACEGGCAWDPAALKRGEYLCTACSGHGTTGAWMDESETIRAPKANARPKQRAGDVARKKAKAAAPKKRGPAEFMKPLQPSGELALIVGSKPLTRTEITKKLWAYIRDQGLQDKQNRRMINADLALRPIFGKDWLSMFEMTRVINGHLTPAT